MKNKFRIDGDSTTIFLSSKDGSVETLIDTKSLEILNEFDGTFRAVWNENTKSFYVLGYDRGYGPPVNVMLHRLITGAPDGFVVDHFNHDTLDNRKFNLRVVTQSENMFNLDPAKLLNKRVPGITWYENKKKWRVKVRHKHIGYFSDKEEAERVLKQHKNIS